MIDTRPYLLTLVTPPATEPLTLAEAKLFLRVDGSTEDSLITSMVSAVRIAAEQYLSRSLITQSWKLAYDDYLLSVTALPLGPVQSITSVTLVARDGSTTIVDSNTYYLSAKKDRLNFDATPFATRVEVVYAAGYGNAANVPEPIKQGMLQHLASLYTNRTASGAIPEIALSLYTPFKQVRL
jgi:uncharacterized phiE125 gp8 family phage protein